MKRSSFCPLSPKFHLGPITDETRFEPRAPIPLGDLNLLQLSTSPSKNGETAAKAVGDGISGHFPMFTISPVFTSIIASTLPFPMVMLQVEKKREWGGTGHQTAVFTATSHPMLASRISTGAGLIKVRGSSCWTDRTCLWYHFETQPILGKCWCLDWCLKCVFYKKEGVRTPK